MKNESGMTLMSLVITIVIMMILTFTVTFSGMSTLEYGRMKAFVSDMQMIQEKVNLFCDKASSYGYEGRLREYIEEIVETDEIKLKYPDEAGIMEREGTQYALLKFDEEYVKSYYRYFEPNELTRVFGLSNIDREVIINFYTREVIDLDGVIYQGNKYYTQYVLPGGDNLIGSEVIINKVFEYTGSVQKATLTPGEYLLQVWGAQGGSGVGGKGAYATGALNITENTTAYVYVGGVGTKSFTDGGGFNGGGNPTSSSYYGGGGATDIRIDKDSLYARVIVAAGGGGYRSTAYKPGIGGAESGVAGTPMTDYCYAEPGTQSKGGKSINSTDAQNRFGTYVTDGSFGKGGAGIKSLSGFARWWSVDGTGGGIGHVSGGGSSWVFTEENYSAGYTNSSYTGGNWLLGSNYFLQDARMVAGNQSMPTVNGESTMNGNTGNGYAKISRIDVEGVDEIEPRVLSERPF